MNRDLNMIIMLVWLSCIISTNAMLDNWTKYVTFIACFVGWLCSLIMIFHKED